MTSLRQGLSLKKSGVISLVGAGGKTSLMFRLAHELSAAGETVLTTTTTKIMRPTEAQSRHLILSSSPSEIIDAAGAALKLSPHVSAAADHASPHDKLIGFSPETIELFLKSNLFRWIIVEADGAARRPLKAPRPYEPVIPGCTKWVIGMLGLSAFGKPLDETTVFQPELVAGITGLDVGMPIIADTLCDLLVHQQGIFQGTPADAQKIAFLNQADIPKMAQAGRSIVKCLDRHKGIDLSRVIIGSTWSDPPILECHDLP
ncbi:MAG: selenium cofactor biosynthesis protein YqeC [Thermodesulfobacteriota bacterium]